MAKHLPLLVFPVAKTIPPPDGIPRPISKPHFPGHSRQAERLLPQLQSLEQDFSNFRASASGCMTGLEPETVLVIEIIGSVDDFNRAIDETDGLEWLGEWGIEDIEANDDFYGLPGQLKIGVNFFKNKIEGVTTKAESENIRDVLASQGFIDSKGVIISEKLSLPDDWSNMHDLIIEVIEAKKYKWPILLKRNL